jgi:hypothetical protein
MGRIIGRLPFCGIFLYGFKETIEYRGCIQFFRNWYNPEPNTDMNDFHDFEWMVEL